jgi:hypothetical protein
MFEAYKSEYSTNFVDDDSIQAKLHESQSKLESSQAQLAKWKGHSMKLQRKSVMEGLLSPLGSYHREVMASILETVTTDKLDATYNKFIGRILTESVNTSEKEELVLAEGKLTESTKSITRETKMILKNGDADKTSAEHITESTNKMSDAHKAELRKLSGIDY